MEHTIVLTHRPRAKRQWKIKRRNEVIRLTETQMTAVVRAVARQRAIVDTPGFRVTITEFGSSIYESALVPKDYDA